MTLLIFTEARELLTCGDLPMASLRLALLTMKKVLLNLSQKRFFAAQHLKTKCQFSDADLFPSFACLHVFVFFFFLLFCFCFCLLLYLLRLLFVFFFFLILLFFFFLSSSCLHLVFMFFFLLAFLF
jgi:hypothetical protein